VSDLTDPRDIKHIKFYKEQGVPWVRVTFKDGCTYSYRDAFVSSVAVSGSMDENYLDEAARGCT